MLAQFGVSGKVEAKFFTAGGELPIPNRMRYAGLAAWQIRGTGDLRWSACWRLSQRPVDKGVDYLWRAISRQFDFLLWACLETAKLANCGCPGPCAPIPGGAASGPSGRRGLPANTLTLPCASVSHP